MVRQGLPTPPPTTEPRVRTTQRYTHVSKRMLGRVRSPLDELPVLDEAQTGNWAGWSGKALRVKGLKLQEKQ
jgi:hypothetical protein